MTSKQKTDPCAALVRTKPNITINDGKNLLPTYQNYLVESQGGP